MTMIRQEALVAIRRLALFAVPVLAWANAAVIPEAGLRQLRFSPDGKYILAQDSSAITVLTAQPLAVLFRIHAGDASNAQFTPDSLQLVFVESGSPTHPEPTADPESALRVRSWPRVERWTVADRTSVESPEIRGVACATEELSPDAGTLACTDSQGTLRIVDVASAESLFQKTQFVKLIPLYNYLPSGSVDLPNGQFLGDTGQSSIDFSPDGRFLVARPSGGEGRAVAWDLRERRIVDLKGRLAAIGHKFCVFVAPHRLLISPAGFQAKRGVVLADLVAFPSQEILSRLKVPDGPLFGLADPGFVLVRPFGRGAFWNPNARRVAAAELATGEVIVSETPALDVLGRYYVTEPSPGTVGLYERGKGLQASVVIHGK
jgi:hypothetical protein